MGCETERRTRFPLPFPAERFYLVFGIFLIVRYARFFDDSSVYFRYVDNLLFLDIGLTYNAGEFVEGIRAPSSHFFGIKSPRSRG